MKHFKFLTGIDEDYAIEPDVDRFRELMNYEGRNEMTFVPDEPPQIYTQMLRVNMPLTDLPDEHINQIKLQQERRLMEGMMETLDITHEIVFQDENSFTLRTELRL